MMIFFLMARILGFTQFISLASSRGKRYILLVINKGYLYNFSNKIFINVVMNDVLLLFQMTMILDLAQCFLFLPSRIKIYLLPVMNKDFRGHP